jgi:glycosyltransferase involved in cell wall biosynthesis
MWRRARCGARMTVRVLQVVTDTDRRGAQVFATDLHAALRATGVAVETVALAPGEAGGLDVATLGTKRISASGLRSLRAAAGRHDVVVAHGSTTLPACAIALAGSGVPFVYRQISDSKFWAATALRRWRVRAALARAAHVVALWRGAAATLTESFGVPPARITIVPNGVAPERFLPGDDAARRDARVTFGLAPDARVLLSIGALVPEKGVDLAIDAVAELTNVTLLVVGAGPERDALARRAESRAPNRVVFADSIADPRDAYLAADAIVLPSRGGDSMPAVLIEAGLMALPCISSRIGAIPDVVRDGSTGLLVSTADATELREACTALIADPTRARALGQAAREHCLEHFAIDRVARRWCSVLSKVAGERQR